jgi:UDP-glucose 4-epimerase
MKILIIGSKGFIGQYLISYFSGIGNEVWGADVVTDYVNTEKYFLIDASNSDFSSVFQKIVYDLCINCSGAASVPESLNNPIRDYYLNTVNVFKMLEAIKNFQPDCRFINLSSAAVYGNPKQLPVKEDSITNPLSPYGAHKLQSEQICKEFHDFYNINTCSLRIFL